MTDPAPPNAILATFFDELTDLDRIDAVELLEQLREADADDLAMQLAMQLHSWPPAGLKRALTLCQWLGVVVCLIRDGHIDRDIEALDAGAVTAQANLLADGRLRGIYETRQQAAFAAVRQIGGPTVFGIAHHLDAALADANRTTDADTLDSIAWLARTSHGWHIIDARVAGYVLYRAGDLPDDRAARPSDH